MKSKGFGLIILLIIMVILILLSLISFNNIFKPSQSGVSYSNAKEKAIETKELFEKNQKEQEKSIENFNK